MISVLRLTFCLSPVNLCKPEISDESHGAGSFSIIIFYCEIVILAIVKWGREELKRQTDKKQR